VASIGEGMTKSSKRTRVRLTKGIEENGIIVGNVYDKYCSQNPIVRHLMSGFESSLQDLVKKTGVRIIHEVGCGEGYWTLRWLQAGYQVRGSDVSKQAIELALINAQALGLRPEFKVASIYELAPPADAAELIVCCEVLEHLEHPGRALDVLMWLASPFLIISVPREPIWRILNLARGSYFTDFGNTPGHLQHWSKKAFVDLIRKRFDLVKVLSPVPWTLILAKRKC
jgi:2-polyprenyl-3-methyl-5-hydroxy-6-metoxy-1,4-benzoquinol methylase